MEPRVTFVIQPWWRSPLAGVAGYARRSHSGSGLGLRTWLWRKPNPAWLFAASGIVYSGCSGMCQMDACQTDACQTDACRPPATGLLPP